MSTPRLPLHPSFWTLHLAGWGTYGGLWYLASLSGYAALDISPGLAAIRVLYYTLIGATITLFFRPLYRRLWDRNVTLTTLLPVTLACSLAGTAL